MHLMLKLSYLPLAALCGVMLLAPPGAARAAPAGARDGQHDFDFEIGAWIIHLRKLMHPLSGKNDWVQFEGTSVTRKVWDGRSQLEEFETDGPSGHIEGLT